MLEVWLSYSSSPASCLTYHCFCGVFGGSYLLIPSIYVRLSLPIVSLSDLAPENSPRPSVHWLRGSDVRVLNQICRSRGTLDNEQGAPPGPCTSEYLALRTPTPAVPCQVSQESTWIEWYAHLEVTTPFQTLLWLPETLEFSGFERGIVKPLGWPRGIISRRGEERERMWAHWMGCLQTVCQAPGRAQEGGVENERGWT